MLQCYESDDCCGDAIADALLSGALDEVATWTHAECGVEWRPRVIQGVRLWTPVVHIEVIR